MRITLYPNGKVYCFVTCFRRPYRRRPDLFREPSSGPQPCGTAVGDGSRGASSCRWPTQPRGWRRSAGRGVIRRAERDSG